MKIGLIGIAGWPVGDFSRGICAPNSIIASLAEEFVLQGNEVFVFAGQESIVQGKIISNGKNSPASHRDKKISSQKKIAYHFELTQEAIKLYKRGEIDVINCHDFRFNLDLFLENKVPVIYTVHEDMISNPERYDPEKMRQVGLTGGGFLNISKANEDFCQKNSIPVVGYAPNGIEIEEFGYNDQAREGILFVGRVVKHKMVKEAIEACLELGKTLTVVGPKGRTPEDEQYFDELDETFFKTKKAVYLGLKDHDQLAQIYKRYKVLIFLSKSEGMPLVILEAMATGLPVVASAVGGIPDIITDGVDGVILNDSSVVSIAKGIKKASNIENSKPRKKIEEKFSTKQTADNYFESYKKFLARDSK